MEYLEALPIGLQVLLGLLICILAYCLIMVARSAAKNGWRLMISRDPKSGRRLDLEVNGFSSDKPPQKVDKTPKQPAE